jgi:hypothetical protein
MSDSTDDSIDDSIIKHSKQTINMNRTINLIMNLDLQLQLLSIPEELHREIIRKYKKAKLFKDITDRNDYVLKKLEYYFINYDKPLPDDFYNNFVDVDELYIFIKLLREDRGNNAYTYIFKCMMDFLEHFNSLKYNEKQEIRDTVLQGGVYDQYNFHYRDRMSDLLSSKKYSKIIDPDDNHSGFSFGWCLSNLMPMVFGTREQKVDHWIKLIRGHFYT